MRKLLLLLVPLVSAHNVVIIGKTGVGKSTLFNNIIDEDVSAIGEGDVGTSELLSYPIPNSGNVLWDTRGLFDGRVSVIEILQQIQERIQTVSTILLAIKMPLVGESGRTAAFPDIDVVELLYTAIGVRAVFYDKVILLFTFAQWESHLAQREVQDLAKSELKKRNIPIPRSFLFAGDHPEGEPHKWLPLLRKIVASNYMKPWRINFSFGALDSAVLGVDRVSLNHLETEKGRLLRAEQRIVEEHRAAIAAAQREREEMVRQLEEIESIRELERQRVEEERVASEQRSLRAQQALQRQQENAELRAAIEQVKIRLAQEDLADIQQFPESELKVAQRWLYRRMSLADELENIRIQPPSFTKLGFRITEESLQRSIADAHARWRIPDDLRKYFKWINEDGTAVVFK